MGIPIHRVPPTYNATPRRVAILARHIQSKVQAKAAAQGVKFRISEYDMIDIIESFIDPSPWGADPRKGGK